MCNWNAKVGQAEAKESANKPVQTDLNPIRTGRIHWVRNLDKVYDGNYDCYRNHDHEWTKYACE